MESNVQRLDRFRSPVREIKVDKNQTLTILAVEYP